MKRPNKNDYVMNRGGSGQFIAWSEFAEYQDRYIDYLENKKMTRETAEKIIEALETFTHKFDLRHLMLPKSYDKLKDDMINLIMQIAGEEE